MTEYCTTTWPILAITAGTHLSACYRMKALAAMDSFPTGVLGPTGGQVWLKSNNSIFLSIVFPQVEGNILRITRTRVEDRGLYLCNAENSAGTGRAAAMVEVESKTSQYYCLIVCWPGTGFGKFKVLHYRCTRVLENNVLHACNHSYDFRRLIERP